MRVGAIVDLSNVNWLREVQWLRLSETAELEFLHRTAIYAPRDPNAKGNDKFVLAANMLTFTNSNKLTPPPFIPRDLANYTSFN